MDIRVPVGAIFTIYGLLLTVYGLIAGDVEARHMLSASRSTSLPAWEC